MFVLAHVIQTVTPSPLRVRDLSSRSVGSGMSTRTTTPGVSRQKKRCNFAERLRIQNFTISFALYEIIWSTAERQRRVTS